MVSALSTTAAADEVDVTIKAAQIAGSIGGVSISDQDIALLKTIVRCVHRSRPLIACAREELVSRMPAAVRPLAGCILEGKPLQNCASEQALGQLPPQVRDLAGCVAQQSNLANCAQAAAYDNATRQAIATIDKFRADGRSEIENAQAGAIRNIIAVSEGIRDDDWVKVSVYGAGEVYKAAAKIILKALLPPLAIPGLPIDPVIDAVIQSRVELVAAVIKGAKEGNASLIGQKLTEVYLLQGVLVPCSIPGIPDDIKEATCGNIGKVIHAVASFAGNIAALAFEIIKDPLHAPAIIWDATEPAREEAAGKKNDCVSREEYYADHYTKCYNRGAFLTLTAAPAAQSFAGELNLACRRYYDRCHFSHRFDALCNPGRDLYAVHINGLASAVRRAAGLFVRDLQNFAQKNLSNVCLPDKFRANDVPRFLDRCEQALTKQFPLAGDAHAPNCGASRAVAARQPLLRAACEQAMGAVDVNRILAPVCEATRPKAPTNCSSPYGGLCGGAVGVKCDAPLPNAHSYVLSLQDSAGMEAETEASPQGGSISGRYGGVSGNFMMKACAKSQAGLAACSEYFPVRLRDLSGPECVHSPPPPPTCPHGLIDCHALGRCVPIAQWTVQMCVLQ